MNGTAGVITLGLLGLVYFCPTLNASTRRHPHATAIALINLMLGWTVIGWVFALIWSLRTPRHRDLEAPLDPETDSPRGSWRHARRDDRLRGRIASGSPPPRIWIQTHTCTSTRRWPHVDARGDATSPRGETVDGDGRDSVPCRYAGCNQLNEPAAKYCARCGRKLKKVVHHVEPSTSCPAEVRDLIESLTRSRFGVLRSWRRRGGDSHS